MLKRREAREKALFYLYQSDLLDIDIDELIKMDLKNKKNIDQFTLKLVKGVKNNFENLNEIINLHSSNWQIDRMSILDRNMLRIALYEIMFEQEIPLKVTINEAIEISKKYGTNESGKFVNGILGKVVEEMKIDKKEKI
ncbi:MAG: transcription antitermination factor NusB [Actinobacteria bacterium]|nr:transcription antitermination factor NusB [Actinomycetota bacterium]